MGNYGITALSGLPGALDRQDQRNEVKDQQAWREESRGQQRKQWDEWNAGAKNRGLAQKNQKMKLLVERADLERIRSIQELVPAFQTIERSRKSGGDRNELGESMAKILSKANAKGIKYVPYDGHGQDNTGETDFKFQSEDGKTYGFRNFQEAYDSIGESFANGENFLKTRQEAINERGIYKLKDGSFKEMTRGEAERVEAVPLAVVRAQEQSETTKRQNAGTYGGTFTDADGTVKAINNRTGETKKVGNHYTSPADKLDIESKQIKQYVSTVNGLLIPFKGKESGSMPMFDKDGTPTVVAENAYKKAQDYLTETLERNEPLTQRDYNDLKTAQAAINAFEEFKVFITGSGQNSQSRGGGVATGGKLNVGKYKIASPGESGGVSPGAGDGGGQPQQAIGGPVSVNPGAINPSGGMSPDARDLQYQNSPTATPHINPALPKDLKQWNVKELRGADGVYKYYAFVSGQREPMEITPEEYKYWFTNKNPARDQTPYRGGLYSPYKNQ